VARADEGDSQEGESVWSTTSIKVHVSRDSKLESSDCGVMMWWC